MANGFDWLEVESLDLEAQGVAHRADGKVVFIEGALPGERVQVSVARKKNQWEQGQMSALARESAQRVRPGCPHFGLHAGACGGCKMQHLHPAAQVAVKQRVLEDNLWHLAKVRADRILRPIEGPACGGCKMQHLHPAAQVAVKQRVLEDNLWHLAKVRPERILRPIEGPAWGYRDRARLSVRFVAKKGTVLIGFHERKSRYVADMRVCPVLPPRVSAMLLPLRELIGSMDQRDRLPQIELAVGEGVTALVLRHLEPLSAADAQRLRDFGVAHDVQWWLQPKGPDSVHRLHEGGAELAYRLPEYGITMPFKPTDFTQVNAHINRVLVDRAVRLLDPQANERVVDWFCGLGNFTLPLASRARQVLGVEGSETLVSRARDNARLNGLARRTAFEARNLFELGAEELRAVGTAERWLVDPPREGAFALAKALAELQGATGWSAPVRIVYVSCNPATLARDAGLLVHQAGYRCSLAGVVNMFPHTAHTESMAVFDLIQP